MLAVLDAADANHARALRAATELARLRCRVFQTTLLRAETHALLLSRLSAEAARRWLSLCDAIAFAVMERLKARTAFTFDRHFGQYGFETVP